MPEDEDEDLSMNKDYPRVLPEEYGDRKLFNS